MLDALLSGLEREFLIKLIVSFLAGFVIGAERESRGKVAGISTHFFVISGAMTFMFISLAFETDPARIASQIVTGIGFLGAGIILKSEKGSIVNLTTAASIWFSAGLGMAIGLGWYFIAFIGVVFSVLMPKIPHIQGHKHDK